MEIFLPKAWCPPFTRSFLNAQKKTLQLDSRWSHDLAMAPSTINWSIVWSKIDLASRNPNHQMIHYNFAHRLYCTPHKLFLMKLNPSPNCQLCSLETTGTFVHMVWDCPGVRDFWSMVSNRMSIVLVPDPAPQLSYRWTISLVWIFL